jgi:hypothetical protein
LYSHQGGLILKEFGNRCAGINQPQVGANIRDAAVPSNVTEHRHDYSSFTQTGGIFRPKGEEKQDGGQNYTYNEEFNTMHSSNIIRLIKSRGMGLVRHETGIWETKDADKIFSRKRDIATVAAAVCNLPKDSVSGESVARDRV